MSKYLANKICVLILQHPQEPHHPLSSASLMGEYLAHCKLVVGLSWPNLSAAWGNSDIRPAEWATLYVGPRCPPFEGAFTYVRKKQEFYKEPTSSIRGLIILDGTWSQSKTLWWRNPWLLKTQRLLLNPEHPSLYGQFRRQPRKGCLSSIEAASLALKVLGENPSISDSLLDLFKEFLAARTISKTAHDG